MSAKQSYMQRMQRVLDFIEANPEADHQLRDLAQIANFSAFHFHRQFSALFGLPVATLIRKVRLRNACQMLALEPQLNTTEIAHRCGYTYAESFSRAFKQAVGCSPTEYRQHPNWFRVPQLDPAITRTSTHMNPEVEIVEFPTTSVAAVEYLGPERYSLSATQKLIAWRRENRVPPHQGQTYGIHYSDPLTTPEDQYRLDVCVSYDKPIPPNPHGVIAKLIPGGSCAKVRHLGSRDHIAAADYLYREWLPAADVALRDFPIFFHYVNVGPDVTDKDMVTDVYLPIET